MIMGLTLSFRPLAMASAVEFSESSCRTWSLDQEKVSAKTVATRRGKKN